MKNSVHAASPAKSLRRVLAMSLAGAALGLTALAAQAQTLPKDALATCTVAPATFAKWFDKGQPSLNGSVKPANSITFSTNPNCDFYAWSHQMFLWLTSPSPALYGGTGRIFNSPVFYNVSNPVSGKRNLIPNKAGPFFPFFPLGTGKVGTDGLPVVLDRTGRAHEVIDAPQAPNGNAVIEVGGKPVEIGRITAGAGGKALLLDRGGKTITAPVALTPAIVPQGLLAPQSRLMIQGGATLTTNGARVNFVLDRLRKANVLERFAIAGKSVFVNVNTSTVIDIDPVQAGFGKDVLLAQNGSIIFYQTVVNDMYAYFLTGQVHQKLPVSNQFPTDKNMADAIVKYAATNGVQNRVVPDREALAIEAKLSWIEVTSALPNPQSYITIQATIPTYNTSVPGLWTPATPRKATLALVGVHVVGSTVGHPEMLWSTFEHYGNTPMATYQYNTATGTKTVNQNTAGTWLFSANNSAGPFNVSHADYKKAPNIEGINGFNVTPSDTLREAPFGTPTSQTPPNPVDATPAAANTELIALNNNIAAMMTQAGAAADLRNNYFQSGTTWTSGGAAPTGSYPGGNEVGTSYLTNSSMETYQQGPNAATGGTNCFTCHTSNNTSVSHMYPVLNPLF